MNKINKEIYDRHIEKSFLYQSEFRIVLNHGVDQQDSETEFSLCISHFCPRGLFLQPIFAHCSNIYCPRYASLSDSKCWNGGQKWVKIYEEYIYSNIYSFACSAVQELFSFWKNWSGDHCRGRLIKLKYFLRTIIIDITIKMPYH